jgi:Fe-S-cluster-containing dehydrogenase component
VTAAPRGAFVFAPDRCTGCEACRVACGNENGAGADVGWRQVLTLNPARHPALPTAHLSLACNHCDTPACLLGCPAAAYRRDARTGAVLLDAQLCIGCRYCSWVCPFDAPRFDAPRGVMAKCTYCSHRLERGGQPACTQACPTGALAFGQREAGAAEPEGPGLSPSGLGPALVALPLRRALPAAPWPAVAQPMPPRKITPRSEWALVVFTVVMPALVAWLAAGLIDGDRQPPLLAFPGLGALAMALSASHLGRPERAWRAILNVRSSWLSREVLAANAFLALGAGSLLAGGRGLGLAAAAAGLLLCVAIDGVYRAVPRAAGPAVHSAEAVPAAVFLLGAFAGLPWLATGAAGYRGVLFVLRWREEESGLPAWASSLRLALLALPCLPGLPFPMAALLAVAGETIDRASFYATLEPDSPARHMRRQAGGPAGSQDFA